MSKSNWRTARAHSFANQVTFFVTLAAIALAFAWEADARVKTAAQPPPTAPVSAGLKLLAIHPADKENPDRFQVGSTVDYMFVRNYSLGIETALQKPVNEVRDQGTLDGIDDVSANLTGHSLWHNRYYGLTLKGSLKAIAPTSKASKMSTMIYGGGEFLELSKAFSDRFALVVSSLGEQWAYEKWTAYEDEDGTRIYNTRFHSENKLKVVYKPTKVLQLTLGGMVHIYQNTNNQTFPIYQIGTAIDYDIADNATFEFLVKSGYARKGTPEVWNGYATSEDFLGPEGLIFYLGTIFQI